MWENSFCLQWKHVIEFICGGFAANTNKSLSADKMRFVLLKNSIDHLLFTCSLENIYTVNVPRISNFQRKLVTGKVWKKENSKRGRMLFSSFFSSFHAWRFYILLFHRIIFNYRTQMCYPREKIGGCFFFFFYYGRNCKSRVAAADIKLPFFRSAKSWEHGVEETSIVFIPMPHLSRDSGRSYNATKVRSCYSCRSSWNRRIQGSQTLRQSRDTLKEIKRITIKEIKKFSVAHRVGVFMLSILICHDWMWNHFNKVLICPVLLPQTNWI